MRYQPNSFKQGSGLFAPGGRQFGSVNIGYTGQRGGWHGTTNEVGQLRGRFEAA